MIQKSSLIFQDNGTPFSQHFNETYFDSESGYEQSQTAFIDANNIFERLKNNDKPFTIAETGFGIGLNFLLTLRVYQKLLNTPLDQSNDLEALTSNKFHFISVEKFPLTKLQLSKSVALFPDLHPFYLPLLDQYPESIELSVDEKFEFSFFNGNVTFTLYIGDATDTYSRLATPKEGLIDVWYLDGFSPSKNPEMWSPELFEQVARLAKEQSTLSTSTHVDFVRNKLTDVGFRFEKKDMSELAKNTLKATYQKSKTIGRGYQHRPKINKPQDVAIIGGGIASACVSYYLTSQGINVTLYCKDEALAQGASSNAIAALFPLLHQQKDDISEFYETAFWRAKKLYNDLLDQGFSFSHKWCGLLDVSYKESLKNRQTLFEKIGAWPNELIHSVNAEQANQLSNIDINHGGLFMPKAGWIAPKELVLALFEAAKSTHKLRIKKNIKIESIQQNEDQSWQLNSAKEQFNENVLVVCSGADSIKINTINELPLTSVRGQITSMASDNNVGKLSTVICHKGYLTPAHKNIHCIGATFDKNSFDIVANPQDDEYNINMLNQCLPNLTKWTLDDKVTAKARLRCMTPDHLPLVGAMPNINAHTEVYAHLRKDKNWKFYEQTPVINNLYVLTGLGARGLCSAPLTAEILTAELCGTPYPVDSKMLFNLSPNRFVIRDLIKRKI